MKKSLVISEQDSIAAILENDRVVEFFVNRGELLLGDIYSATVENILPGIDAAFVNLGKDKMGFLHANDVPGQGPLKERLVPKQKLLVQITKEPTGHKGPRVSTAISLPGRFLVLVPEERGVSISRRISEARERARLKSVVNLMKPPGVGLIIRTEAKGQGENELFEDFEQLWDRWQTVVSEGEASIGPTLIYRDQDLLYRVIRDAYSNEVTEIICDTPDGQRRAQEYLQGWAGRTTRVTHHSGEDNLLVNKGVDKEIEAALSDRVEMPSGGHLNIQPTEALTVIDVNSGRFTSSRTQAETVRRTNLEAAQEIARQLRLRNIGGMVIVDFIDMDSRKDQQQVLEVFQRVLEEDRAKPQVGQLSDLGLVELTRRRQGQSLRELFTVHCNSCSGLGVIPVLEIGSRVISFKGRDEEANRRGNRRPMRPQAGVLRAATAHNGRVLPTVEDEVVEEFDTVPEDILEQMPDDLLHDPSTRQLKNSSLGFNDSSDSEEEEPEAVSFDTKPRNQAKRYAPSSTIFEESFTEDEDDDPKLSNDLSDTISAVHDVFNDMGSRSRVEFVPQHEPETDELEERAESVEPAQHSASIGSSVVSETAYSTHHSIAVEPEAEPEQPDETVEEEEISFASSSPYETEYDPVTGVYRLKARNSESEGGSAVQNADIASDVNEASNSPHSHEEAGQVLHSLHGEQLNLFSNIGVNSDTAQEQYQHAEHAHHSNEEHATHHDQHSGEQHQNEHQQGEHQHGEHQRGEHQHGEHRPREFNLDEHNRGEHAAVAGEESTSENHSTANGGEQDGERREEQETFSGYRE